MDLWGTYVNSDIAVIDDGDGEDSEHDDKKDSEDTKSTKESHDEKPQLPTPPQQQPAVVYLQPLPTSTAYYFQPLFDVYVPIQHHLQQYYQSVQ